MVRPVDELDILEKTSDHSVAVAVTSTQVMPANPHRTGATFINDSDETIYLALGWPAVASTGIRLNATGGSYEINRTNLFKGEVNAIHAGTGTKVLCAVEIETRHAY